MKTSHPDSENEEIILPSCTTSFWAVGKVINRLLRAFLNEETIYRELKMDPKASTEAHFVILLIAITAFIGSMLFENFPNLSIDVGIYYFSHFFTGYYLLIGLSWIIGVKILRGESTLNQIRVALAYGFIPQILFTLPYPLNALGLWSAFTQFSAIRKTLCLSTGKTIFTMLAAITLENHLTPIVLPWVTHYLFFWAIPSR